jgi:hypothetical protein
LNRQRPNADASLDNGDITGCTSATDFGCVCTSAAYANSVAVSLSSHYGGTGADVQQCWVTQQCSQDNITLGIQYTTSVCQPVVSAIGRAGLSR